MKQTKLSAVLLTELFRYALVSGAALAIDFSFLLLFSQHLHYLLAASISFVLGGFVAYYLSVRFVFQQRKLSSASTELGCFLALGLVGLGINTIMMALAVGQLGLAIPIAKALAASGTFSSNFVLRRWLLFTANKSSTLQTT